MLCSRCRKENDRKSQRYCKSCHAAYMREHRTSYSELSEQEKKKVIARAYANVYKKRNKISVNPCFVCSSINAEMHHEDYEKPTEILWLCRQCHLTCHNHTKPHKTSNTETQCQHKIYIPIQSVML